MNTKIRSINFDLTPSIEEYINKKISSLEKFISGNQSILCEVEIGRTTKHHNSGDIFKAEVNIMLPQGRQVYTTAEGPDIYTAIDMVRDETERALVSEKDKKDTLFRRGASKIKNLLKRIDIRNK